MIRATTPPSGLKRKLEEVHGGTARIAISSKLLVQSRFHGGAGRTVLARHGDELVDRSGRAPAVAGTHDFDEQSVEDRRYQCRQGGRSLRRLEYRLRALKPIQRIFFQIFTVVLLILGRE